MNAAYKLSALVIAGLPLVWACGGDNLTLPSEGAPAHLEILGGNGQEGPVNSDLALPLRMKLTDSQRRPIEGATVEFVIEEDGGGGSVNPISATTDAKGEVETIIRLGTQVGTLTGQARVPVDEGSTPVATNFTANATSTAASGLSIVSGNPQSAPVGTALSDPLVVQVTDGFGNPISGVTIQWTPEGGGSVSETSNVTAENGQASVIRTLGSTAGEQRTLASAEGIPGPPVSFTHTATAGTASRVEKVSGDQQNGLPGTELENPLVVRVLDAENNPIAGRAVEWVIAEGGGTPNPARSTTDPQGYASTRWTLGPTAGRNRLNAVVSGVGVGRIEFTATAGKVSSATSITSIQPDQSGIGEQVTVSFSVTGVGGTPTGSVTVNGESVAQPCTAPLSNGSASCTISFTSAGNHRITATYSGDARYAGSSDDANHKVNAAPNLPPVATADQYSMNEDEVLNRDAGTGVLANDADLESNPLTAVRDSDPAHGTLTLNSDGSFSYTPAPDFSGTDTFTYHASDGTGVSAPVTVSIIVAAVDDAPIAQGDAYTTPGAGQALTVSLPSDGVLSNDNDPEGAPLNAQISNQAQQGTVVLNLDGTFTYTPAEGASGSDAFTYSASDGALSSTATVTITIQ